MRVEIWSDVVCPWCYIGKARFDAALEGFAHRDQVEIVHRSFELDPTQRSGGPRPVLDVLAEKYGVSPEQAEAMEARVAEAAAGEGLEYTSDRNHGNTFDLHRLLHFAKERGRQDDLLDALYRAHFGHARPVLSDPATVIEVATAAGLDADEAARVLADETAYAAEVRADESEAAQLGATGVPFFVIDRKYGISGGQPAEVFRKALEQAYEESAVRIIAAGGDDACADGACAVPQG